MKTPHWQNSNVVWSTPDRRLLWQFKRSGDKTTLHAEHTFSAASLLPKQAVAKTVRDLWQPRLNIAWLPTGQVFLRVVHLPPCEPGEIPAMVEFQLEKLSPLPIAQTVWSTQPVRSARKDTQTVVVIAAARSFVEPFLGELEGVGFLADRLDSPFLHEMLSGPAHRDSVWLYARREAGKTICLAAWWGEDRLEHVDLFQLPDDLNAGAQLAEMLRQVAWAGEMEGWWSDRWLWHLVADSVLAAELQAPLAEFVGREIEVLEPLPLAELAALSASASRAANLLPVESATRYRQQSIDRLWMRGLGALAVLYLVVLAVFFGGLKYLEYRKGQVDDDIGKWTADYNQALQLKAKVQILQEQVNLKYAALDCWKAASEVMPEEMALGQLTFQRGKKLGLFGTVPSDQQTKVTEYNEALTKSTVGGQPLFGLINTKSIVGGGLAQGNRPMNWSIECEIKRSDL